MTRVVTDVSDSLDNLFRTQSARRGFELISPDSNRINAPAVTMMRRAFALRNRIIISDRHQYAFRLRCARRPFCINFITADCDRPVPFARTENNTPRVSRACVYSIIYVSFDANRRRDYDRTFHERRARRGAFSLPSSYLCNYSF